MCPTSFSSSPRSPPSRGRLDLVVAVPERFTGTILPEGSFTVLAGDQRLVVTTAAIAPTSLSVLVILDTGSTVPTATFDRQRAAVAELAARRRARHPPRPGHDDVAVPPPRCHRRPFGAADGAGQRRRREAPPARSRPSQQPPHWLGPLPGRGSSCSPTTRPRSRTSSWRPRAAHRRTSFAAEAPQRPPPTACSVCTTSSNRCSSWTASPPSSPVSTGSRSRSPSPRRRP